MAKHSTSSAKAALKNSTPIMTEPMMAPVYVPGPYSLTSTLRFLQDNAGLLFLALSIFVVGFLAGSLWAENNLLKKGVGTVAPVAGTQAAPAAGNTAPAAPAPVVITDDIWKNMLDKPAGKIGNDNAKVKMVEFTDYQCPFCGRYYKDSFDALKKKYVDTGKVQMILHDQPLTFHPNSRIGALAARCGGEQGKFLEMHDQLFGNQDAWVNLSKDDAIAKYGEYAGTIGINKQKLIDCVKSEKYGKEVDADIALASKVGADGTPTFFIDKAMIVGAQPTTAFEAAIDKALAK
jgi:protein-disulfide isomerase